MNRREFTRNMLAAATIPALPVPSLAKAQAVVVPKAARFWAIYMTHLHGDITPGMLTQMTGIAPAQTTAIRAKLIADNVIAPTGFIQKSLAAKTVLRSEQQAENTLARIRSQADKAGEMAKDVFNPDAEDPIEAHNEAMGDEIDDDTPEDLAQTSSPDEIDPDGPEET